MKTKQCRNLFITHAVLLLMGAVHGIAETKDAQAAGVLFQQFEIVFRAKANLLSRSGRHDFRRVPFSLLLNGLSALGKQVPAQILDNSEAVLVGTKDYIMPKGLGMVRSTVCYVIVLRDHSGLDFGRHFDRPVSSAAGSPVWNWSADLQEFGEGDARASSLYMSEIEQSYILLSNDLEELTYVAVRLRGSGEVASAVLGGLREWGDVSRHEFWGYRRYRHSRVLDKFAAGMRSVTANMEALTLSADSGKGTGILRLLSSAPDDTTAENAAKMMPLFNPQGPGVWQAVVPLENEGKDQTNMKGLFEITWLFGFGLVL